MDRYALALAFLIGLAAPAFAKAPPAAAKAAPTVQKFGAPVSAAPPVALAAVVKDPDKYSGKTLVLDGQVRAACSRKGCWMELAPTAEKGTQGCRVTFKDYGFFVPVNSAGAAARVDGVVEVRTLAKDEVAHYESEGATFARKGADGTAKEIRIVASGVELTR